MLYYIPSTKYDSNMYVYLKSNLIDITSLKEKRTQTFKHLKKNKIKIKNLILTKIDQTQVDSIKKCQKIWKCNIYVCSYYRDSEELFEELKKVKFVDQGDIIELDGIGKLKVFELIETREMVLYQSWNEILFSASLPSFDSLKAFKALKDLKVKYLCPNLTPYQKFQQKYKQIPTKLPPQKKPSQSSSIPHIPKINQYIDRFPPYNPIFAERKKTGIVKLGKPVTNMNMKVFILEDLLMKSGIVEFDLSKYKNIEKKYDSNKIKECIASLNSKGVIETIMLYLDDCEYTRRLTINPSNFSISYLPSTDGLGEIKSSLWVELPEFLDKLAIRTWEEKVELLSSNIEIIRAKSGMIRISDPFLLFHELIEYYKGKNPEKETDGKASYRKFDQFYNFLSGGSDLPSFEHMMGLRIPVYLNFRTLIDFENEKLVSIKQQLLGEYDEILGEILLQVIKSSGDLYDFFGRVGIGWGILKKQMSSFLNVGSYWHYLEEGFKENGHQFIYLRKNMEKKMYLLIAGQKDWSIDGLITFDFNKEVYVGMIEAWNQLKQLMQNYLSDTSRDLEELIEHIKRTSPPIKRMPEKTEEDVKIKKNYDYWLKLGVENMVKKHYREALDSFEEALKLEPQKIEPLLYKATVFGLVDQMNDVENCINEALEIDPQSVDPYLALHQIYRSKGKPEKSLEYLKNAENMFLEDEEAWNKIGKEYENLEDLESALRCYDKALSINPESTASWLHKESIFRKKGDLDIANSYLENASSFASNDKDWDLLGWRYIELEEYEKARNCAKRAISMNPENVKSRYIMEEYHKKLNEPERAKKYLNEILEFGPKNEHEWNYLGVSFKQIEDFEKAKLCYTEALNINPKYKSALLNLGLLYAKLSDPENAIDMFLQVIDLEPTDELTIQACAAISKEYEKIGRNDLANQYMQQAFMKGMSGMFR